MASDKEAWKSFEKVPLIISENGSFMCRATMPTAQILPARSPRPSSSWSGTCVQTSSCWTKWINTIKEWRKGQQEKWDGKLQRRDLGSHSPWLKMNTGLQVSGQWSWCWVRSLDQTILFFNFWEDLAYPWSEWIFMTLCLCTNSLHNSKHLPDNIQMIKKALLGPETWTRLTATYLNFLGETGVGGNCPGWRESWYVILQEKNKQDAPRRTDKSNDHRKPEWQN